MSDKKENTEWNDREIGALWVNVKQGSNDRYLTGQVNGEKVIMFKNKYKETISSSDFRIYKQKDQEGAAKTDSKKNLKKILFNEYK